MLTNTFKKPDFSALLDSPKSIFKITENSKSNKTEITLHLPFRDKRSQVENFVWQGFKKHFDADIQHFLPNLISIERKNKIESALGFRSAKSQPLFIEQYLEDNIESFFVDEKIKRHQIGEIGNLYGVDNRLTRQLFVITIMAVAQTGYTKLVFCATPQVKNMLHKLNVTTHHIGSADPVKLGSQKKFWGSYYDTLPELLAINVDEPMSLISKSRYLTGIAQEFSQTIDNLATGFIQ